MVDFFAGQIPTAQQLDDTALVGTVVAQLRQTVSQSIANNTPTPLTMDTEDFDLLGGHSTATNPSRYTCQREGWYQLAGGVGWVTNATGTHRGCQWRLNGGLLNGSQQLIPPVTGGIQTIVAARSYMVYMVVGDFVELHGEHAVVPIANLSTFVTNVGQSNMQVMYAGLPN